MKFGFVIVCVRDFIYFLSHEICMDLKCQKWSSGLSSAIDYEHICFVFNQLNDQKFDVSHF